MLQCQINDISGILVIGCLAEVGDFFTENLNRLDAGLPAVASSAIPAILSLLEQLFPSSLDLPTESLNLSTLRYDTERVNR